MHFMRMTPTWVSPAALRDRKVFLGRRGGMSEAVTSEGELILRIPLPLTAARTRLAAWGLAPKTGPLPVTRCVLAGGTAFQHRVWQGCLLIGRGRTATYGELAKRIGCRSAQAVGQALGANPLAKVIPCHRVRSATGAGGFAWGERRKAAWLKEESDGAPR
jgi:O-6-methylguanine DNA methyltransferase